MNEVVRRYLQSLWDLISSVLDTVGRIGRELIQNVSPLVIGGVIVLGGIFFLLKLLRALGQPGTKATSEAKRIAANLLIYRGGMGSKMANDAINGRRKRSPYAAADVVSDIQDFVEMVAALPESERKKLKSVLGPEFAAKATEGYSIQLQAIIKKAELIAERELRDIDRQLAIVELGRTIEQVEEMEALLMPQVKKGRFTAEQVEEISRQQIAVVSAKAVAALQGSKSSITDAPLMDSAQDTRTILSFPTMEKMRESLGTSKSKGALAEGISVEDTKTDAQKTVDDIVQKTRFGSQQDSTNGHKSNGKHP